MAKNDPRVDPLTLVWVSVRTQRNALVCRFQRYLKSLDLVFAEYPPTDYIITIGD